MNELKLILSIGLCFLLSLTWSKTTHAKGNYGVVCDNSNKPVSGATVTWKAGTTITDKNGQFVLNTNMTGDLISVKKEGFECFSGTVQAEGGDTIVLSGIASERVTVLQAEKPFSKLSESVSYIKGDKVSNLPGTDRLSAFEGRMPGLLVMQTNGMPGWENSMLSVRGNSTFGDYAKNSPVVIIDGHEADINMLDAYDIESITVLKDAASTAIWGLSSANGVILVNTKRGTKNGLKVSFNNQTTVVSPGEFPKTLDAEEYVTLYNEALTNDKKITGFKEASNNNNYINDYFANSSVQTRNNLNIRGGGDELLYSIALNHTSNNGLLNTEEEDKTYSTNTGLEIINLHANIDINVNNNLNVSADIKARKDKRTTPGEFDANGIKGLINNMVSTPPNAYPIFISPDSLGGTSDYRDNIYGKINRSGYAYRERYYIGGAIDFEYNLPFLQNMSIIGGTGYHNSGTHTVNRTKGFAVYEESENEIDAIIINKIGDDSNMTNSSSKSDMIRRYYGELGVKYSNKFENSLLDASLLAESRMTERDYPRLPQWKRGLKGRADYSYNATYLASFAFALQGSEQYPEGSRYGFFPGFSLGWVASNENFMDNVDFINSLKLRASIGRTGMDYDWNDPESYYAYFAYLEQYVHTGSYPFGTSLGSPGYRFSEISAVNNSITWAKSDKIDLGFDLSLFDNKISLSADYFYEKTKDILVGGTPGTYGIGDFIVPQGELKNTGIEGIITWNSKINNDFNYYLSANATYAKNTIINQNEDAREYKWMERTGNPVDARFGYVFDGFFTENDYSDIEAHNQSALGTVIPGSLKYKDLNNDGTINENDIAYIGNGETPEVWYGFSGGLNYKNLDLNFQLSGVARRTIMYNEPFAYALQDGTGSANEWHLERWQPGSGQNAGYPSVSLDNFNNNRVESSFWIEDAGFIRLKSVEIGYTLPQTWLNKIKTESIRFFATGYNLLTISKVKQIDPASSGDGLNYPMPIMMTGGVNITF